MYNYKSMNKSTHKYVGHSTRLLLFDHLRKYYISDIKGQLENIIGTILQKYVSFKPYQTSIILYSVGNGMPKQEIRYSDTSYWT